MSKKLAMPIILVAVIIMAVVIGIGFSGKKGEEIDLSAATEGAVTTNGAADEKSIQQIIEENAQEMKRRVNADTSSNPFDYIDQECFDNIAALGFDAVPVLEENRTSLWSYHAGLLILEITGCDMLDWSNGEEFFRKWEDYVTMAPQELSFIICSDDMEVNKKLEKIKPYGILGEAFVKDVLAYGEDSKLFCDVGSKLELAEDEKEKLAAIITSDESEIEKACQYLVNKKND